MAFSVGVWRAAWRSLRATPVVSGLAVLSLALGIGANTALFSIFNALLLKPLPVENPAALAYLDDGSWTYPIWEQVRLRATALFDGAFAWSTQRFNLSDGGEVEPIDGAYISGEAFDVLGLHPVRGRLLQSSDDVLGATPAAVISHRFWQRRFGGGEDVIGQRLTLQRVPFTIVGVMPSGFLGPDVGRVADVMIPFAAEPLIRGKESFLPGRSTWWLDIMVRLKPGQSVEAATTALRGAQPGIRDATMPLDVGDDFRERYLTGQLTLVSAEAGRSPLRDRVRTPLVAMIAAVGLVLLIACGNIANLMLARALTRAHELSVRLALGASRWHLARMLLAESAVVCVAGAALGLIFAQWSAALLVRQFGTWRDAVVLDLSLDWRVLAFTAGLATLTALVSGLAPALGVSRLAPNDALKESGRTVAGDRRWSLRTGLVVLQLALSLVLVAGAGLFLRTFAALTSVPLGFTPDPMVVVSLNLQTSETTPAGRAALIERFREVAGRVPGARSAALSLITPLSGQGWNAGVGPQAGIPDRSKMTWRNAVSPGWFDVYGMRMLVGRDFATSDRVGTEEVAIVNQTFAARFLAGQSPVGQLVPLSGPGGVTSYRVIGVVSDAVYRNPREGFVPTLYVPIAQQRELWPDVTLTVASAPGQRAAVQHALGATLRGVDARTSFTFRTFDELARATVVQERLVALLSSFFGGLALLLAAVGLYGVVSHAVSRRRTEFGVRMALGADPGSILRLVFRHVGATIGMGLAAGAVLSLWLAGFVQSLLFKMPARDPLTFGGAIVVLLAIGLIAAWLPARRAAALDPAAVLREG